MNCLSKDDLIDYLFGEAPSDRTAAEAHFSACPACRVKMEALKQIKAAAASVPPAPVSADFTAKLLRRMGKRSPAPAAGDLPGFLRRLASPAWGFGLAAFAAACLGVFFLTGQRSARTAPAEALYFSDGPATVNSGFRAPGGVPGGSRAGYVFTDNCETARCGIL